MTDNNGADRVDAALDRVVAAARTHLAAVKANEQGERDDDAVWSAYIELNNASQAYDDLLNAVFGEVTPWDLEKISTEDADGIATVTSDGAGVVAQDDPYPQVISVRQRRDYRVPSISALYRLAEEGRVPAGEGEVLEPVSSIGEAVLELLQSGDGSLGMLDVRELEPLDGVVVVAEVGEALSPDAHAEDDGEAPFRLVGPDRILGRLDERALLDMGDEIQ